MALPAEAKSRLPASSKRTGNETAASPAWLKIVRSPACMILVGLAVRLLCIVVTHSYRRIDSAHIGDVNEMVNLGYSLASGHGFSSPYLVNTGPSAWTAPLYPWLISLAFRAFGIYSNLSGFAMLAFNSLFSALTSWTVYRTARRMFNGNIAVWSGWAWAFMPYAIYFSVTWVWETAFSTFLLSLLFMLTLEMEDDTRLRSWFGYGLLWGTVGLTNTSLLMWLPFAGCWIAYQLHRRGKRFLVPVMFSAAIFWITMTPWLIRNYLVFGEPLLVRGDFGNEFRAGNNPQAEGWVVGEYHVGSNHYLLRQFQQVGEAQVNAEQAHAAEAWIAQNPERFLELSFHRFIYYWAGVPRTWTGERRGTLGQAKNLLFLAISLAGLAGLFLALKRRVHGVFLFATLICFYPLIYYVTFAGARYRHPIDPQLTVLAVFLFSSLAVRFQRTVSASCA